jgi:hypothetical protein
MTRLGLGISRLGGTKGEPEWGEPHGRRVGDPSMSPVTEIP